MAKQVVYVLRGGGRGSFEGMYVIDYLLSVMFVLTVSFLFLGYIKLCQGVVLWRRSLCVGGQAKPAPWRGLFELIVLLYAGTLFTETIQLEL